MKKLIFIILFFNCCLNNNNANKINKTNNSIDSDIIIKSSINDIDYYTYKVKGKTDSIKGFYKNNKLASIEIYGGKDSLQSKFFYSDGSLKSINLNKDKIRGKIFQFSYYINGKTESIAMVKDSRLKDFENTCNCTELFIAYYQNTMIKERGCQGIFNGTGTPIGTWIKYDSLGNLLQTIYYHPDEFGKDYKVIKRYNIKGRLISNKIYNNSELYETQEKRLKFIP